MCRCSHHIRCSVSQRNQFPCSFFFCICRIWGHRKLLLKAKAHNRLVLTCWEEAGTSAPVLGFILLCWEVWEKSPKGLIKETYLQEQRHRQTACTHIITQRWQSAGRHRSADHVCRPPCPFNWINTARGEPEGTLAGNVAQRKRLSRWWSN